jgi:hypothetical protein
MSNETLISIAASILFGIILSYWGIWHSKRLKDKHSLSLVNEEWISLLTTFQDKFETLKIEFTQPITTNQYYYRGSILNTGTVDLDKSKMYAPLEISFPETCQVNECKIAKQSSERFLTSSSTAKNKVFFEWDLLKPQEYFSFECIVESSTNIKRLAFQKSISISERIADLKEVQQIDAWNVSEAEPKKYKRKQLPSYIGVILMIVIFGAFAYRSIISYAHPDVDITYKTLHATDKTPVTFERVSNSNVALHHNNATDTVALKDASNFIILKPILQFKRGGLSSFILYSLLCVFFIWATVKGMKNDSREVKRIKLINNIKNSSSS